MSLEQLRALHFGYIPYQPGAGSPGDRRRFPLVARKLGLNWEIYQPGKVYDVLYATSNADLTTIHRLPRDGTKIVYEMVDSYLAVPDWEAKALVRGVGKWLLKKHAFLELSYRRTVAAVCRRADLVVCSTPEQREQMVGMNDNVHPILDFHEELGAVYKAPAHPEDGTLNLFWEGIGLTAAQFTVVSQVLRRLSSEFSFRLHFVTDLSYKPINAPFPILDTKKMLARILGPVECHLAEWNPTSIRALASHSDLGIIPLRLDQPMFASKPENKLLIMWRLGLPVVVSATPAYRRTMGEYGGPNWACDSEQSWYANLREALESASLRKEAASKGFDFAETHYGVEPLLQRWLAALTTLVTAR